MIYGELGVTPLSVDMKTRILSYWAKLLESREINKLSSTVYNKLYEMYKAKTIKSVWIENVKTTLCSVGFSGFLDNQNFINTVWFTKSKNQRLKDQFIQKWTSDIDITSQSNTYRIFKTSFQQSAYISILPNKLCQKLLKFRTRNHRFPIETGRWRSVPINERLCPTCSTKIGDEFHFLFTCPQFHNDRIKYLLTYFYKRPNVLKFEQLMNSKNKR